LVSERPHDAGEHARENQGDHGHAGVRGGDHSQEMADVSQADAVRPRTKQVRYRAHGLAAIPSCSALNSVGLDARRKLLREVAE
jgi:hypothetical protein